MMAGIRGRDTKPEMLVRSALHRYGFRFRLHSSQIPGRPDLVLPRYRAVIFVHGCFWHGHDCCYFKWPSTRPEFWRTKIQGNRKRDQRVREQLRDAGWRQLVVWECAVRDREPRELARVISQITGWLRSGEATNGVISGGESL